MTKWQLLNILLQLFSLGMMWYCGYLVGVRKGFKKAANIIFESKLRGDR